MQGGITAQRRRDYARGYLALGLCEQAAAELAHLTLVDLDETDSIDVFVDVGMERKTWPAVVDAARELVQRRPTDDKAWIAWAYALRELGRIEEALAVLLQAEPLHGSSCAVLHYNIACYYSLLGKLSEARKALRRAFLMHPPFRQGAKEDPDLKALLCRDDASGLG